MRERLQLLTQYHIAEHRRDCYWLYIVTNCDTEPKLQEPIQDPARLEWHEVKKVEHYYLSVEVISKTLRLKENKAPYGKIS